MTVISNAFSAAPAVGELIKVLPGVYWLKMPLPFELDHINLYLLEEEDGWTLVDCGLAGKHSQLIWQQVFDRYCADKPVTRIVVTHYHPDHLGSAGWLCRKWNVPLYITQAEYDTAARFLTGGESETERFKSYLYQLGVDDAEYQAVTAATDSMRHVYDPLPDNVCWLRAGDKLRIDQHDWDLQSSIGHSPEHCSLYCHELGLLISGDQVLQHISSNVSLTLDDIGKNPLADWFEGLESLQNLPESTLVLPSHNDPFYGLHKRAHELRLEHLQLLKKVKLACKDKLTVAEIARVIYERKLNNFTLLLALGEALAHAQYLYEKGELVRNESEDGHWLFSIC